jgi:hypothetical protein
VANPHPIQTEKFIQQKIKAYGDLGNIPLAEKQTQIRLPIDVDRILRSLPPEQRVPYLRRIISESVRKDFS